VNRLIFHPEAVQEYENAVSCYCAIDPALGKRFYEAVEAVLNRTESVPLQFREVTPGIRRALVRGFPYAIIFHYDSSLVQVLAIMPLKRKPGYWSYRQE
jgi:toxin ParE1/3/4